MYNKVSNLIVGKREALSGIAAFRHLLFLLTFLFLASCTSDSKEWEKARLSDSLSSYKYYLSKYPEGQYKSMAVNAIDSINIRMADSINTWQAYQNFVDSFPDSRYMEYARKKVAKEWWSVSNIQNKVFKSLSMGNALNAIKISSESSEVLLGINMEVTALRGDTGRLLERLEPYRSALSSDMIGYLTYSSERIPEKDSSTYQFEMSSERPLWVMMHKAPDVSHIATQLFISSNVKLVINETDTILPIFASLDGYGTRLTDNGQYFYLTRDFDADRDPVAYFLCKDMLAAWFLPEKKAGLTLFFPVPAGANAADLFFYDLPAERIYFEKE